MRDAADVIGDLVFHPVLRAADLKLERKVVLEEIAMVDDTPDDLVFEVHNEQLWGDNGYGYRILGTRDTVASLTTNDLRDAARSVLTDPETSWSLPRASIDHDELVNILGETGWLDAPAGGIDFAAPPPAFQAPSYTHVERTGAQTHSFLGATASAHGDDGDMRSVSSACCSAVE